MKIGLIDVDGHNFPNLALMRISAYHKAQGDLVEWRNDHIYYDIVYMSKIFSDAYSPDITYPINADRVIRGGTGYCIHLENGKEVDIQSEGKGCYVDEMLLNGKSYQHNYLDMRSLMQGTQITYRLSEQPNLQRGTHKDDAPYSFSRK